MWLILSVGVILSYCLRVAQAQFVFAHFMVSNHSYNSVSLEGYILTFWTSQIGNTEHYYDGDWYNDIALAKEAHIDAFALNIAYAEVMNGMYRL